MTYAIKPSTPFRALCRAHKWDPSPRDVVVTVDPALRTSGVALWSLSHGYADPGGPTGNAATFVGAADVRNERGNALDMVAAIGAILRTWPAYVNGGRVFCLIEKMQDYKGKAARADGLDKVREVTDLLRAEGAIAAWTPNVWKGQVPKDVHHKRLQHVLPALGYGADAWDAIGIGLYAFGATRRGGAT